eukprot:SAG22_NODE_897_length_6629_cov_4.853446_13_plen_81_part_00
MRFRSTRTDTEGRDTRFSITKTSHDGEARGLEIPSTISAAARHPDRPTDVQWILHTIMADSGKLDHHTQVTNAETSKNAM